MTDNSELLTFIDEESDTAAAGAATENLAPWRILIVDDDADIHEATRFALRDVMILDRPLDLLHADSAAAALAVLEQEKDIAVILLDVVMETATAGLDLVELLRTRLGLVNTRIILRTGQPGHAPEIDTVRKYDINDYHTKSELTRNRLFVALSTAIRAYDQFKRAAVLTERLHSQAFVDALVNLPNRNSFIEALDSRLAREGGQGYLLALLDIDQFAEINDMFGHGYADRLLQAISRRLEEQVGGDAYIARVGTDTFGLLGPLEKLSPARLGELFSTPFMLDMVDMTNHNEHVVSIATGLVKLEETHGGGADCLKDASIAVKHAKARGQGQTAWFTPAIGHETRERTRLLHALREAYNYDRLFPVYQPQVCLETGRIIGFEALMRWRTAEGTFVPPDAFIPVAENSGLVVGLGTWILRMALRAAGDLRQAGLENFHIAVNVSVVQFRQPDFLATLDAALLETGIAPENLELEITESVAMMGAECIVEIFSALKQRGIALAIDDFGTGFSSLAYLDQLPADRIKIDRSFVTALETGQRGARIAEMVIPLGRKLGMKVLAEGIENDWQAARLKELGCDEGQGYLYARPMPLPDVLQWVKARRENPS
jgi:diguanylate cyclase